MEIKNFTLKTPGKIVFGLGSITKLGEIAAKFGDSVLVVRGKTWASPERWQVIGMPLAERQIRVLTADVHGEPSPGLVDRVIQEFGAARIDAVIAVGGGSAIDAGKAVSALLPLKQPVMEYLEDVGARPHTGVKLPFIAVPTTAGTGSEASANAVLSIIGPAGFKKSLRHENFVPNVALVDPELAFSCPPAVTAACGMDALTQLLEAYVSTRASPMTDGLIESALPCVRDHLVAAVRNDPAARTGMAYASLVSGIALANAGLGVVHGIAGPLGAYCAIPHGAACGTLLGAATEAVIAKLKKSGAGDAYLKKYAYAGSAVSGKENGSVDQGIALLIETVDRWTAELEIPRLSAYGICQKDIPAIAAASGDRNSPVTFSAGEIAGILASRL